MVGTGKTAGPESLTLIERFIHLMPFPYTVTSLILAATLLGRPGIVFFRYLDSLNINEGLVRSGILNPKLELVAPLWQIAADAILFSLTPFYLLYMIRYMRMKLVAAEPELLPISPEGEETLHKVFGRVSSQVPQILLSSILIVAIGIPTVVANFQASGGLFGLIFDSVSNSVYWVVTGSFIWVYFSSLRGLHELGNEPLKLKLYSQDRMLGLRPVGSLSLLYTVAYFGFFLLGGLYVSVSINIPAGVLSAQGFIFIFAFVLLGIVMFFLPLNNIHRRMLEERRRVQASIRSQFSRLAELSNDLSRESSETTLTDLKSLLTDLKNLQTFEMAERKAATIATWPFDTQVIGRLTAIIITVLGRLLARIIGATLQFPR